MVATINRTSPYIHSYDRVGNEGKIKIAVPLNYMNGSFVVFIQYRIEFKNRRNNSFDAQVFITFDQYISEIHGFANKNYCNSITLCPNKMLVEGISQAIGYAAFVKNLIEEEQTKKHPPSFEEYLRSL